MKFGIYRHHEPLDSREMKSFKDTYGTEIRIISVYRAWNRCSVNEDMSWLERLQHAPCEILLTWEPWTATANSARPYDQPAFSLKNILSGKYDNYMGSLAKTFASFTSPIYLRVMHEMNGNWYPWCGTVNDNSPEDFISAWNHIRDVVNREALSKVQWVWSPYAHSYPAGSSNRIEDYFPGDNAIDCIALDGYNWGLKANRPGWQSFEEVFSYAYKTVTTISKCPVIIGETACAETGGSKGQWITDAFKKIISDFPRIEALVWFDIKKECDWRIGSSDESLKAFRASAGIFNAISE